MERASKGIMMVMPIVMLSILSFVIISSGPSNAQTPNIACQIGPFLDKNHIPVQNAKVYISYGPETMNGTTAANGTALITIPRTWVNETVSVKLKKDGYKDTILSGTFDGTGKFTPTNGSLPTIETKETAPVVDYQFLVLALIMFIVLLIVLVGMKGPSKSKRKHKNKMDEVKGIEEE